MLKKLTMNFLSLSVIIFIVAVSYKLESQVSAIPLEINTAQSDDQEFANEYASLRHGVIHDLGYTEEFADLVEINLKRAVKEERERQKQQGIIPTKLRQGMQGLPIVAPSSEDYEDEDAPTGPTTPGPSSGDVVRGVAGILAGIGTLNLGSFWQSFVNFFPPNQREGAQAVVNASLGRRPAKWPTVPTTTTKLTTTTNSNELDSDETTKTVVTSAPVVGSVTPAPGAATVKPASSLVTTSAPVISAGVTQKPVNYYSAPVTPTVAKVPTTKYKLLVRRRTSTVRVLPDDTIALRGIDESETPSSLPETTQFSTTTSLSGKS